MVNTVRISLDEYLILKRFQDDIVNNNSYSVYYWEGDARISQYYLLTNDAAVKELLKLNEELASELRNCKQKEKPARLNWIQRLVS
jgi:hypothetical protein